MIVSKYTAFFAIWGIPLVIETLLILTIFSSDYNAVFIFSKVLRLSDDNYVIVIVDKFIISLFHLIEQFNGRNCQVSS